MHDCHEGEQVSIFLTHEQVSYFNIATEEFYTVQNISCSDNGEDDSLREIHVPTSGRRKHANFK